MVSNDSERCRSRKADAIRMMGGKCVICGYDRNYNALHFHHIDPTTKEASWSQMRKWPWNRIVAELKKCTLLCANCHAEYHYPDRRSEYEGMANRSLIAPLKATGHCRACKTKVFGTDYCSTICARRRLNKKPKKKLRKSDIDPQWRHRPRPNRRKVKNRPDQETLLKQIREKGYCGTARLYGVSDNAVRKWAKSYCLLK